MSPKKIKDEQTESESESEIFESDDVESNDNDVESNDNDVESSDDSKPKITTESSETNKTNTFIKLENNADIEIRYVYHISDIHIRNTQRHAEYKEVFEKTFKELKSQINIKKNNSIIILTGDIMHTKTELSPEAVYMAYHFFKALQDIAPVILIPGNHDCNLSNKNRLDALSPIVDDIGKLDNLYYLKKSGIYQFHNIIFGITSVFDNELVSAKEISNEVWNKIKQKNKYKIALYHGPVHGAKTDVGYRMNNEQLVVEDFEGYHYVMLGDIHKHQFMDEENTVAYAGSLIQQSYGETLANHGILKWDLLEKESELIEIKNNYGYCTVKIVDGKIVETLIPKKPRIRFILENTNQLQYQEIVSFLEQKYQINEIIKDSTFKTKLHATSKSHHNQHNMNLTKKTTAYATQEEIIKSYLKKKDIESNKIKSIIELHKKIYQKILEEKKEQVGDIMHNATKNQKWKLLKLNFSNILSYGKDNVIDFTYYEPNKIIGIVAPNHYGKSAILDVILFCLFDKFSRGDRRDIMNKNEKKMYCSLLFRVGSQKYLIERIGQRNKNGLTIKIDVNFYLIKKNKKGVMINEKLNGIDKNDTNKKIVELIGDYNDYLTTCFCLQQGKSSNFMDMTQLQKKEYLNEILRLNVFEDCHNWAKDKFKKITTQLKMLEQKIGTKSLDEIKNSVKKTVSVIRKLEIEKEYMEKELMSRIDMTLEYFPQAPMIKYNELSDYDLDTENDILVLINNTKKKLNSYNNININDIIEKNHQLNQQNKLLESEIQSSQNDLDRENSCLKELIKKKDIIVKKLVTLPKNINSNDIEKINIEKTTIAERIKNIDSALNQNKNDNLSEKINRIDQLKKIITNLRNKLKPVETNIDAKINTMEQNLSLDQNNIIKMKDEYFENNYNFDDYSKDQLLGVIKMKKQFANHLRNNNNKLQKCNYDKENDNSLIISQVVAKNKTWLDKFNVWKKYAESGTKNDSNIVTLMDSISHQTRELVNTYFNYYTIFDNEDIQEKIRRAESELDTLSEFSGTKKEIDNLKQEKKLLLEKNKILDNKALDITNYLTNVENNKIQQDKIDKFQINIDRIQKIVDELADKQKNKNKKILDNKNKIIEYEKQISANKKEIEENKKLQKHLQLLEEYHLFYKNWIIKFENSNKWTEIKKEIEKEISTLNNDVEKKKVELDFFKKELTEYLGIRKDFDEKSTESNNLQLYVQIMNYNGLPYEILKTYLPLIESDVNQILHSMVNFSIEFMFYDDALVEEQKNKQLKSNAGSVNINICYQGIKPYNVQLASGFERFIIGLAIRMTLCQISLTAKPNFLIIDEGWSCLDTENLNNVSIIMAYIKSQYEHVIIISHLEELKSQADYIINIEKENGYSYIRANDQTKTKRKIIKK